VGSLMLVGGLEYEPVPPKSGVAAAFPGHTTV